MTVRWRYDDELMTPALTAGQQSVVLEARPPQRRRFGLRAPTGLFLLLLLTRGIEPGHAPFQRGLFGTFAAQKIVKPRQPKLSRPLDRHNTRQRVVERERPAPTIGSPDEPIPPQLFTACRPTGLAGLRLILRGITGRRARQAPHYDLARQSHRRRDACQRRTGRARESARDSLHVPKWDARSTVDRGSCDHA